MIATGSQEIVVDGRRFLCSRVILAARSSFFGSMFNPEYNFQEMKMPKVKLGMLHAPEFLTTLKYIYYDPSVNEDLKSMTTANLMSLYQTAQYLGVSDLLGSIESLIHKNITAENLSRIWALALSLNISLENQLHLLQLCKSYLQTYFVEVMANQYSRELTMDMLKSVLEDGKIGADT